MKVIRTEIEIESSAEKVWDVITRFEDYPKWNPLIPRIIGNGTKGERLEVVAHIGNGKEMTFRPTVLKAKANHEFRWRGRFIVPVLFSGEHAFIIKPVGENTTRLIHQEEFRGILVLLFLKKWGRKTREGFIEMNKALKRRVEGA